MILLRLYGDCFHALRLVRLNAGLKPFVYVGKGEVHPIAGREGREGEQKSIKFGLDADNKIKCTELRMNK
jgi:hypothetical protein